MRKQRTSDRASRMGRGQALCQIILLCTFTGVTSCEVQMTWRKLEQGGVLEVTCSLRRDPNATLTQVSWVLNRGPSNQSSLGVYEPAHGAFVPPEYMDTVGIQGSVADRSSSLSLLGGAVEEEARVCCIFNAFPSGVSEVCSADMRAEAAIQEEGLLETEQIREVERWTLMIGGFLVCFLSVTTSVYLLCKNCLRNCCRRSRVWEVHTRLNDLRANSEDILADSPPGSHPRPPLPSAPPQAAGFDPAKLYAKIRLDLLYGRLWKSYQGTSRARAPDPPGPPDPKQSPSLPQAHPERVYSLLTQPRPLTQEEVTLPSPKSDLTSETMNPEEGQGSEVMTSSSAEHSEEQHVDEVTMT